MARTERSHETMKGILVEQIEDLSGDECGKIVSFQDLRAATIGTFHTIEMAFFNDTDVVLK